MSGEVFVKCKKCGEPLSIDEGYYNKEKDEWLCHSCKKLEDEAEKEKIFCCRNCGGTEYEEVTSGGLFTPVGSDRIIDYYFCLGCSVMFKDPKLFSKQSASK